MRNNDSIPCSTHTLLGGLPRGWTCEQPGAVKDSLADLYPWVAMDSQVGWLGIFEFSMNHYQQVCSMNHYLEVRKHKIISAFSGVLGLELGLKQL